MMGYSLEPPCRGAYNEFFSGEIRKTNYVENIWIPLPHGAMIKSTQCSPVAYRAIPPCKAGLIVPNKVPPVSDEIHSFFWSALHWNGDESSHASVQ